MANTTRTVKKAETEAKAETGYRIIGRSYKTKRGANEAVTAAHKKGFKNAGLFVQGDEFVLLYGTYATKMIADANLAAVKKAGFNDAKVE